MRVYEKTRPQVLKKLRAERAAAAAEIAIVESTNAPPEEAQTGQVELAS